MVNKMKKYFLILGLILIGLTSCTNVKTESINNVSHINFENSQQVLLDVRTLEEYEEGHLPNAINIDFKSDDFEEIIDSLDKSKTYYVYCKTGKRSQQAVKKLKKAGINNLVNLKEGYSAYKK